MKTTATIRRALRALFLSALFVNCSGAAALAEELAPPVISIGAIHSPTWVAEGVQIMCTIRVENPNGVALPVASGMVRLKLADTPAARGRLPEPVTIPAYGVREINLPVDVTTNAAVTLLPMFLANGAFTLPYDVAGYVVVELEALGRINFHETGKVSMTGDGLVVHAASPN